MNSFFAIVWTLLRKIIHSVFRFTMLRFFIVSLLLIGTVVYYVNCNEIPQIEDYVSVQKLAGRIDSTSNIKVHINRNFSAAYNKSLCSFIPEYDNQFNGNYNAIILNLYGPKSSLYDKSTFKPIIKGWNSIDDYTKQALTFIPELTKADFSKMTSAFVIHQAFQLKSNKLKKKAEIKVGQKGDNKYSSIFYLAGLNEEKSHYMFGSLTNVLMFDRNYNDVIYTTCSDQSFNYFSPQDISQMYVHFQFKTDIPSSELSFNFWGNTEFSKMLPEPDFVDMYQIKFTNQEKIDQIKKNGLIYFVKFSDTSNIQSTRMFIVATIITVLLTLWLSLLYEFIPKRFRKS